MAHYRRNRVNWITEVKPIGFPSPIPESQKTPNLKEVPSVNGSERIKDWLGNIALEDMSPPPHDSEPADELKLERQKNQQSYAQGLDTGESSWTRSSNSASPFELKLAELDPEVTDMENTESRSDPINATSVVPSAFNFQNPTRRIQMGCQRRPQSASSVSTAGQLQDSTYPQEKPIKLNPLIPSLGYPNAARPLPQYKRLQYDAQQKLESSSRNEPGEKPRLWKSPDDLSVFRAEKETVDCLEAASRTSVWLSSFKQWPEAPSPSQQSSASKYPNSTVKSESEEQGVQQTKVNAEEQKTGSVGPVESDWPDPETTEEEEVKSRPRPEPALNTIPNAGAWPDAPKLPRIVIPNDYDEDPRVAKALAKVHLKFRRRDEEEDISWHGNPLSDGPNHDQDLSIEVGDMDSDDNKFEASELIEYKDLSWCIAVPIDKEKTSDKNIQQHLVYSYQFGIDRLFLTTEQTAELKNTLMIKYRKVNGKMEVVPIYSALPSTGLLSVKYRHNKGIEVRVYGVVNFIDLLKDPNISQRRTMVWTDALGPLYISSAERSNIRRKLMGSEEKIFAPLRMCMLTVKGEFNLGVANGYTPKWSVISFQPLIEEGPKDPNIGRNLWPARILRFDDLVIKKMQSGDVWLQSYSNPDVLVFAGSHLTGILLSAGPKYTEKGVMMGFVVPYFIKNAFAYYEALIVGPPRVVMILTEGRFLNYYPKTWPPAIEKMCERYRRAHELKLFARTERNLKPLGESVKQMKSMQGFNEFHFDFDSYDE